MMLKEKIDKIKKMKKKEEQLKEKDDIFLLYTCNYSFQCLFKLYQCFFYISFG